MLVSPRIAGLRQHRGQVVGTAAWEPIISAQDCDRIVARLDQQATSGRRAPRRYLLTGLLRCGRCENRLYSSARETTRRYVCSAGPDHGGCGRLSAIAAPVEELIAEAVLYRLDTPDLAAALAGRAAGNAEAAALAEHACL
ncbi:MAG: zinc ribbon domain-containing protein [Frankiaceae bacterium]